MALVSARIQYFIDEPNTRLLFLSIIEFRYCHSLKLRNFVSIQPP